MAGSAAADAAGKEKSGRPGFFARVILFLKQVLAELKKVVTPTRGELANYVVIVLLFVVFMVALISGLDYLFGQGAFWIFGNGDSLNNLMGG